MEDRYSVLIRFVDQFSADGFYSNFNGKKFSPGEAEICHILYLHSVEYTEYEEVAGTPPADCTEIPTCPICLERLDPDTSGILTTLCDHSFQCPCVSKSTYLSFQVAISNDDDHNSSVGLVFLPLRPCKRTAIDDEDSAQPSHAEDSTKTINLTENVDSGKDLSLLKILSYTVWFWEDLELQKRMKAIGDLVQLHSPDFICVQEVTPNMYDIFKQSPSWKVYHSSFSNMLANDICRIEQL